MTIKSFYICPRGYDVMIRDEIDFLNEDLNLIYGIKIYDVELFVRIHLRFWMYSNSQWDVELDRSPLKLFESYKLNI